MTPAHFQSACKPFTQAEQDQIDELVAEVEGAVEDCMGDNPDVGEDDATHDIVMSVTYGIPARIATEVKHRVGIYMEDFD